MATAVGLIVLAALVAGFAALVPDEQLRRPMWVFIYAAVAAGALFCWTHNDAPRSPNGWLFWAAVSVPAAALLFAVDGAVGWVFNPNQTFLEAATSTGWFLLNFGICPLGTSIALSGWVRSLLLEKGRSTVDT